MRRTKTGARSAGHVPRRAALVALLGAASGAQAAADAVRRATPATPATPGTPATALAAGPWRIVVAYPPGGISDAVARLLAARLGVQLGRVVTVQNQAGAGGAIALRALARAAPDGRTLVFGAITPLAFDLALARHEGGVAPVAGVMLTPSLLVGTPAFRGTRFDELVAQARARPGALRWATSGVATTGHLVLEQVCRAQAISVTHVPYKGGGQQLSDALGGQFELLTTNLAPLQLGHVRDGHFKPLAVGAPTRLALLEGVPTLAELGCPQANLASLFGLFAPGATPAPQIEALNAAVNEALQHASLRELLHGAGSLPAGGSAAAFAREIARASAGLARLHAPER